MYPRVSDLFRDLLGVELPLPIYSFGLMVAVAIFTAAALARRELDRLYALELVPAVPVEIKDAKGRTRMGHASPGVIVWTLMLLAAGFGVAGSKLFHLIDFSLNEPGYWERFVQNPLGTIFSPAGLTFYGGLICAGIAIAVYVRRKGIPLGRATDAIAPGLILAYGIGRIGCYLAGDGDWGICADPAAKPSFLPMWLWSETFPRNILNRDLVAECGGVGGVYPTMLYEFIACALCAWLLWTLRKHPFRAGWLFSLYLVLTAVERFTIEIIRVNPDNVGGLSQSQVISIVLFVAGLIGLALLTRRTGGPDAPTTAPAPSPAVAAS